MSTQDSRILESAKEIATSASSWADVSNALFDAEVGLIARAYPTRDDRAAFLRTKEYKAIRKLLSTAMDESGLIDGATPKKKSGKFVLRLPRSLHAALEKEATDENVSMNQLVLTKLAVQLSQLANSSHSDMAKIAQAYLEVREGFSTDRVVADPDLNRRFLRRCHELGVDESDFDLNWKLFTARKNRYLTEIPKTKIYTPSKKDEFEFSSEIAVRYIQEKIRKQDGSSVSLDRIICDPALAYEFDRIAAQLAPGFTPLDYRWIALGVRKAAGRYREQAKAVKVPTFEDVGKTHSIKASKIPAEQGIYIFRYDDNSLFVGETDNLRSRIERHFDVSGHRGLPEWLFDNGRNPLTLGMVSMPGVKSSQRKIIEVGTVNRLQPYFNYIGSVAEAA
jgi:site-specific DNA-methyltransferase (adenine-specific)